MPIHDDGSCFHRDGRLRWTGESIDLRPAARLELQSGAGEALSMRVSSCKSAVQREGRNQEVVGEGLTLKNAREADLKGGCV